MSHIFICCYYTHYYYIGIKKSLDTYMFNLKVYQLGHCAHKILKTKNFNEFQIRNFENYFFICIHFMGYFAPGYL